MQENLQFSAASDLVKKIAQETQGLSEGQARVVADVSKAIGSVFLAIGTLPNFLHFKTCSRICLKEQRLQVN